MCGIVGLVGVSGERERVLSAVTRMADRIRHRGPDGGGETWHPDACLGMRRLAIVDVEHGHQPMLSDDGQIALVYNGEIYNAPEIRERLVVQGVRFKTRSDTEVILRLYERDPDSVEEHLAGMWAFAIHDRRRRRVVLSRDRFGIKPLFVARGRGGAFGFASELRCFDRRQPELADAFTLDPASAHAMLSWSYVPCEDTMYRGVKRIAPATRVTFDLESHAETVRKTWTLVPSPEAVRIRSLGEAGEAVEALLRRSVVQHLESDVPLAMFLSGGIDSSLVAQHASAVTTKPIRAYSIAFDEGRFDESPFAKATADKLGIPLEVRVLDEAKALAQLPDALAAYDEPLGDSSSLATYLLSRIVGADFKVALAGDGGDEIFAGYTKYQLVRVRRLFARTPRLRDLGASFLRRLPGDARPIAMLRRRARGLEGSDAEVYARLSQWAPLATTAPLVRDPSGADRYLARLAATFEAATGTELQRTLAADLQTSLTNDMLVKVDRASMACHLEVRVPFLDHRVVELGVGLPERFLLGTKGKRVLRYLHEKQFGPALARRKKRGFEVPRARWLAGPFAGACERLFAKERLDRFGLLSPDALSEGRHVRWLGEPAALWHAFALAAWCEVTMGDGRDGLHALLLPKD